MAPQQGFQYEKNAAQLLKEFKLCPKNFIPAGAGHDQPDLMLLYKKQEAGCELKITAASAGSLVLQYRDGKWGFGDIKREETEKLFLKSIADDAKIWDRFKKEWKEVPFKREPKDELWQATAGKLDPQKRYERDRDTFPDIRGEINPALIENYYNKKKTYYVNVGTHGFYLFGAKNPLKLKGVPRFADSAKAIYRARVQYKGSGNYQFTFELQFSMKSKSPFNIAPVDGKSVNIQKKALNLSCFL